MTTLQYGYGRIRGYLGVWAATLAAGALLLVFPGMGDAKEEAAHQHVWSPNYVLNIDPVSGGMVGKEAFRKVGEFFADAERAIETKDLPGLMALYSEGYMNGTHRKADIAITWKTIFADFNSLAMVHNMRFITTDAHSNVIIVRCSGILVGEHKAEKGPVALDSWMNADHVLVKEDGKFRIIGSEGAEQKRLWFDKPLHPLF